MKTAIREFAEGLPVEIEHQTCGTGWVIIAKNEGGYNRTEVSLEDVLVWARIHLPGLWEQANAKVKKELESGNRN